MTFLSHFVSLGLGLGWCPNTLVQVFGRRMKLCDSNPRAMILFDECDDTGEDVWWENCLKLMTALTATLLKQKRTRYASVPNIATP